MFEFIASLQPIYAFVLGILTIIVAQLLYLLIGYLYDVYQTKKESEEFLENCEVEKDEKFHQAREIVNKYKKSLRFQTDLDPDWLKPLIENIPKMVEEISIIYYPDHPNPLTAPGIGQFNTAVGEIVLDISDFLQNKRIGRMFDRSLSSYHNVYKSVKKYNEKKPMRILLKLYSITKPVRFIFNTQTSYGQSFLLLNNVAVRTIQPMIINIISRRAIELYSGKKFKNSSDRIWMFEDEDISESSANQQQKRFFKRKYYQTKNFISRSKDKILKRK